LNDHGEAPPFPDARIKNFSTQVLTLFFFNCSHCSRTPFNSKPGGQSRLFSSRRISKKISRTYLPPLSQDVTFWMEFDVLFDLSYGEERDAAAGSLLLIRWWCERSPFESLQERPFFLLIDDYVKLHPPLLRLQVRVFYMSEAGPDFAPAASSLGSFRDWREKDALFRLPLPLGMSLIRASAPPPFFPLPPSGNHRRESFFPSCGKIQKEFVSPPFFQDRVVAITSSSPCEFNSNAASLFSVYAQLRPY